MCIINKVKNLFCNKVSFDADYYNGSENDLLNVFLELKKTLNNCIVDKKRTSFLIEEGLYILELQKLNVKSFKFTKNEVDDIIWESLKKFKSKPKIKKKINKR